MAQPKKPKPARGKAFGILNPYGDLWTYDHFPNEGAAREHVRSYWSAFPGKDASFAEGFKVVPVRVTVSALPPPPHDAGGRE